jgi:hypothetical protein
LRAWAPAPADYVPPGQRESRIFRAGADGLMSQPARMSGNWENRERKWGRCAQNVQVP